MDDVTEPAAPPAKQTPVDQEIERWFLEHFNSVPLSGNGVEFSNIAYAAKETLKLRLAALWEK